MNNPITRRTALRQLGAGVALAAGTTALPRPGWAEETKAAAQSGQLKQSVCRWCFKKMPLDDLCAAAAAMGLRSVELIQPQDFATVRKHGLICAMVDSPRVPAGGVMVGGIDRAWNRLEHHDALVPAYEAQLRATAAAGFPHVICFSGNRAGLPDEQGLENCATGLRRILPLAEKTGVTLCFEMLNSHVDHPDYMGDRTAWAVELCRRLSSERFRLLYDIYHMQIMEGDVIATIRRHHEFFAHYHTAGVPGRHEIDDTQELNYPAIMRAIIDTGFTGYVAQEFVPARADGMASLRQGVQICAV